MREVKFRARVKGDSGTYQVGIIDWVDQCVMIQRSNDDYDRVPFEMIQALEQWTNMDDREGIPIYDGDKVEDALGSQWQVSYDGVHWILGDEDFLGNYKSQGLKVIP